MKYTILLFVFLLPLVSFAKSQDEWLDSLSQCESGGRENITVLDSNNRYSYGILQFQLNTFIGYGKQYGILPQEFTRHESLLLIHNPFVQRAIAREMLSDGLSYHWKNCAIRIGLISTRDS